MTGILDQYLKQSAQRRVANLDEVFAIALARTLCDLDLLDLYLKLVPAYPHAVLANAAQRLIRRGPGSGPQFTDFYRSLTHEPFAGSANLHEIVGFKIDRHTIGAAVMVGPRLAYTSTRSLRFADAQAVTSASAFVRRVLSDHPDASLALEAVDEQGTRRAHVLESMLGAAREFGAPCRVVPAPSSLAAFAVPPCKTRDEARAAVRSVFPGADLTDRDIEADASAIAIVAYCRRLLDPDLDSDPVKAQL